MTAWQAGADGIKVFPCNALGGATYIKALRGPFLHINFVPTGGVSLETVAGFLNVGCIAVGVGSELIDAKTIAAGKYEVFVERARQFLRRIADARNASAA
ncbi:MAG: bifunctional 4-hydroxy-2-oxoglutarate aldolase/2-dehydro-3-deoxy-phosphogluconate aldolase [Bryobacteraceae bacterium]